VSPGEVAGSAQPYGGAVTRATAFAIDIAIMQGILFVVGVIIGLIVKAFSNFTLSLDTGTVALAGATWLITFAIYFVSFWSLTGQTPGMRALGVKVTTLDGEILRPKRGLRRVFGMIVAAIPLFAGYFLILVQDKRRGLHDLIAGTVVRYTEDERPPVRRRQQA
jgi:uncharacterized RDD family membrane protein YckC